MKKALVTKGENNKIILRLKHKMINQNYTQNTDKNKSNQPSGTYMLTFNKWNLFHIIENEVNVFRRI